MTTADRLEYDCCACGARLPVRLSAGQVAQGDHCCPHCGGTALTLAPQPDDQISEEEAIVIVAAYTNELDTP